MRTFVIVLLLLALAFGRFALEVRTKSKYDEARREVAAAYLVAPMDHHVVAFLARVQSNWTCWEDITNGPDADILKLVGKSPTVRHLIETFNYEMPPFHWFSPSRNKQAGVSSLIKAKYMPVSLDKRWHVSTDGHIAFLLCKSNTVVIYQDEPSGLRASYYVDKKGSR